MHGSGLPRLTTTLLGVFCSVPLLAQTTVTLNDGDNNGTAYDTTGNDTTFTIAGGTATQSGLVSGTGNVIKTGAGGVVFTAENTFAGNFDVQEGNLSLTNTTAVPFLLYQTAGVSVGDTAAASMYISGKVVLANFSPLILGNSAGGNGTLTLSDNTSSFLSMVNNSDLLVGNAGTGTLNLTSGGWASISGSTWLGAGTGGIGNVTMDAGYLNISQNLNIAGGENSVGSVTVTNGSALSAGGIVVGVATGSSGQLNILNGGRVWIDDTSPDELRIGSGSGTVTIDGGILATFERPSHTSTPITITNTATFEAGRVMTLSGVISGTGTLLKTGVDPLDLTADNTYTGGTSVSAGWLRIGTGGTTGSVLGDITNNAIVEFNRSNDHTFSGVISGTGSVEKRGSGNLTLTADHTYTGGTTVWGGTLTLGAGGTTGSVTGNINNRNQGTVVFNRSDDFTYNGVISGTGSVVHDGNILRLNSAQTYTGTTTVNAGTLVVNGALSASSAVTVLGGATLQGSGTINGSVTIEGGGTLATGTSIESLATGDLTLLAASVFAYEIDNDAAPGVAGDLTAVTGDLSLDPGNGSILTISELGTGTWSAGDKLTLISYSGNWNGGLFDYLGNTLNDDSTFSFSGIDWQFNYNDTSPGTNFPGDLTGSRFVTMTAGPVFTNVIPEPTTPLLGGIGLLLLLRRNRRPGA